MLYAVDKQWWEVYAREVAESFSGDKVCGHANTFGAVRPMHDIGLNSGAGALLHAAYHGAKVIIMLGYDCGYSKNGMRHWHGDHPSQLGNAGSVGKWPSQFAAVAEKLKGVRVINASRETSLTCFERMPLKEALKCSYSE